MVQDALTTESASSPSSRTTAVVTDPVSTQLRKELQDELKQQGLLVWLDTDDNFTPFVDDLMVRHRRGAFPYPVVAFRGSFLALMSPWSRTATSSGRTRC